MTDTVQPKLLRLKFKDDALTPPAPTDVNNGLTAWWQTMGVVEFGPHIKTMTDAALAELQGAISGAVSRVSLDLQSDDGRRGADWGPKARRALSFLVQKKRLVGGEMHMREDTDRAARNLELTSRVAAALLKNDLQDAILALTAFLTRRRGAKP